MEQKIDEHIPDFVIKINCGYKGNDCSDTGGGHLNFHLDIAFPIQKKLDELGCSIEKLFTPLTPFNDWLNNQGHGNWKNQLAIFLAKLPLRVARNIITLLYNLVKTALYVTIHPAKSIAKLAKLLVDIAFALTMPHTYVKIGAGLIGASLGQGATTGNPFSVLAIGIGAAFALSGLSIGALSAAIKEERETRKKAVHDYLFEQSKILLESLLTCLCLGVMVGRAQNALYKHQTKTWRVGSEEEAKAFADRFVAEHHLPPPAHVYRDGGNIIIDWNDKTYFREVVTNHQALEHFRSLNPGFINSTNTCFDPESIKLSIQLNPLNSMLSKTYSFDIDDPCWTQATSWLPLEKLGIVGRQYPLPPENVALSQYGPVVGAAPELDIG